LRGVWHGTSGTCRCPAHPDRTPSLSVADGDGGKVVVHCFAGCTQEAVISALRSRGVWAKERPRRAARFNRTRSAPPSIGHTKTDLALAIWQETIPAFGTATERYLRYRGIGLYAPDSLHHHQALKHHPTGLTFDAMVASVQDSNGQIVAVHRTYLLPDGTGKAQVSSPKMALGPLGDGAVSLHPRRFTFALLGDVGQCFEGIIGVGPRQIAKLFTGLVFGAPGAASARSSST